MDPPRPPTSGSSLSAYYHSVQDSDGSDSENSFSSSKWTDDDDEEDYQQPRGEVDEKKQVRFKEGQDLEQWKSMQSLRSTESGPPDSSLAPPIPVSSTTMAAGTSNTSGNRAPLLLGDNERAIDIGNLEESAEDTSSNYSDNAASVSSSFVAVAPPPPAAVVSNYVPSSTDDSQDESDSEMGFRRPLPVSSNSESTRPPSVIEQWNYSPLSSPNLGVSSRPGLVRGGGGDVRKVGAGKKISAGIKSVSSNLAWDPCTILIGLGKTIGLLYFLYMFVCSLDVLSTGFRLIGGRTAGEFFSNSELMQNPIVGVMLGILTTVFVQSSSTSTSIIVGMVAANFMTVQMAIPLIMGANIGTSITNTIVSFMQAGDREQFERAFAGATIQDMFNWITVTVLLIVEVLTGFLYHTSGAILNGLMPDTQSGAKIELLSVLTDPFVNLIIQLDEEVLACWTDPTCISLRNASLIKRICGTRDSFMEMTQLSYDLNDTLLEVTHKNLTSSEPKKCDFLFASTSMGDAAVGAILLVAALVVLCSCLIFIVKILSSVLQGQVATAIEKTLNAEIPYVPWITGYIAIFVGALMTFLVQSSSVFTSAITPLIGLGVISLERAYPLTLGANVGTTTTALIASMAVDGSSFKPSMQIALVHLLFNFTGILLFYPVPFMRFPIPMARYLGKITAKYRWFALMYIIVMFAVMPAIFILLSLGGRVPVIVFCSLLGVVMGFIGVLTLLQRKIPRILPDVLKTWKFLPVWLRSLEPYDSFFTRCFSCCNRSGKEPKENIRNSVQSPSAVHVLASDEV